MPPLLRAARLLIAAATPLVTSATGTAQATASDSGLVMSRLVGIARLWGAARYLHPALATRPLGEWDSVLIRTIPSIRSARSSTEFSAAAQSVLDDLHDPVTAVLSADAKSSASDQATGFRWEANRTLVIAAGNYYGLYGADAQTALQQAADSLKVARTVVIDLRTATPADPFAKAALETSFGNIARSLTRDTLLATVERRRVYYGYDSPGTSGQYRSGWFTPSATPIAPSPNAREIFAVFLLNENSGALHVMVPLQSRGKALVLFQGDPRRSAASETVPIELGEGLTAAIRTTQPTLSDGRDASIVPDEVIPPGGDAINRAVALAQAGKASSISRQRVAQVAPVFRDRSYSTMRYPTLEYRILGAVRLWSVIDQFYPYKNLLDRNWHDALPEMIRLAESARNEAEYARAVAQMSTLLQDSHAYVAGATIDDNVIGTGLPPIRIRLIQDSLIVTQVFDLTAARSAGVSVGDVLVAVDGVDAKKLYAEMSHRVSVSTPQSGREKWSLQFMHGKPGSTVEITLRDRAGHTKHARLTRRHEDFTTLYHRERTSHVVRLLPGNIGYVDLDRLDVSMIDSTFTRLGKTKAIIFDMRGYPNGTIYSMAPRFTSQSRVVAVLGTPMIGHGSPAAHSVETFAQTVDPAPPSLRYRGKTVMLIDERTVSQAELTGMWMKELNGTVFVGSESAGANGEVTTVILPGGITVGFTGQSVVFPDGTRLQRAGLKPDVRARPTIAGIRAGRDEVLEAAMRFLSR